MTPNRRRNPLAEKDSSEWKVSALLIMLSDWANAFKSPYAESIEQTQASFFFFLLQ